MSPRRALVLSLIALLPACALEPLRADCHALGDCDCPAARQKPDGACCPAWTLADSTGACRDRNWSIPSAADGLGDPGARSVSVDVDAHGLGLLAWQIAGQDEIHLACAEESSPGRYALRFPSANLPLESDFPTVVAGTDGSAVIAWTQAEGDRGAIFTSDRDPSGAWRDPAGPDAALSFPPTSYQPRPATDRSGAWLLIWNQWTGTGYGVSVASRAAATDPWIRPSGPTDVLSPHVFFSNTPVPAVNDRGQALISWYQSVGGPLLVFVSERPARDAAFSHPTVDEYLSVPGGAVDSDPIANPKPAIAADGSAAVVWTQEDGRGDMLVYLATRDAAGRWTKPLHADDSFSRPKGYARSAQLAFGPKGELYLVWYQDEGAGNEVFAARRRADGTWAEDGRHATRLSTPGARASIPRLAVGPDGGVLVAWQESLGDLPITIASRRVGGADEPWGPIEVLSPDTGDDAVMPAVAVGPHDRGLVAWAQGTATASRVFVARAE